MAVDIAQLLAFAVKNNASDLHLSAGMPPMIRVDGDVKRINMPPLAHKEVHSMVYDIMNDKQRKAYEEFFETDFSFEIPKLARFRVNAFNQQRGAGAVFRNIPSLVLSLEDLNAPKVFKDLCMLPRGLVLVTGPTGSGKSTTLAGMVNHCNDNRPDHILTIEDPIEFVHESKRCLINQREVHRDTLGFSEALRSALRLGEAERVPVHLALVDQAALRLVHELDRILDREDVVRPVVVAVVDLAGVRGRLAGAGGPGHEHQAARQHAQVLEHLRRVQVLERQHDGRDGAEPGAGAALLVEGVDAEAREFRNLEGKIGLEELFVRLALLVIHDVVHHAVHFFVRQRWHVDALDVAVDADHRRHAC